MGRSDIYVKIHQLSDAELIKILQFQGDDDGEADTVSVMVEKEIARRKVGGAESLRCIDHVTRWRSFIW
jgi:hypothetical protein